MPKPPRGDQRITLRLVSTLSPGGHWWPYQKYRFPTGISLGVTETLETLYQDNVLNSLTQRGLDDHVEIAVLVHFIRLATWHGKKFLFCLQTPGYGTAE